MELPKWILTKKACVNIKYDDEFCFKYCVQSKIYNIYKKEHPETMTHYKDLKDEFISWDDVNFPTTYEDIDRFEEINNRPISINV